jgi:hypothetical protein
MSPPVKGDADKQLMNAVPWVSDPQRQDETRRLQEDVVAAAQRLLDHGLAQTRAQPSQPRTDVGFRLAEARPSEEKGSLEDTISRVWAQLKPEVMLPPPREQTRLPGMGLVAGLIGAVGVAAAIALVVANVVEVPTIKAAVSSEDAAGRSQSLSTAVLEKLPQIDAAQASVQPAEAPTGPMLATTQTNAIVVPMPSAAAPPTSPKIDLKADPKIDLKAEPAQPEVKTPPAAALPEPRATISLSRDEIASLLKRGQDLIAAGDIASGRLMLTHLAEAGDAEASFILAGTFDPVVLANLRVVGVLPDPAKARAWYEKAAEQGSIAAKQRLQQALR